MATAHPYFPLNPAQIMTTEGVAQIFSDDEAFAAMWRLALHSWVHGPIDRSRAARVALSSAAVERLIDAGVLVHVEGDRLVIPWLEQARETVSSKTDQAKRAAAARWAGHSAPVDADAMRTHTGSTPPGVLERKGEKEETGSLFGLDTKGTPLPKAVVKPARSRAGSEPKRGGNALTELWEKLWNAERPEPWRWTMPRDATLLAKALKEHAAGDMDTLGLKIQAMLRSSDQWIARNASPGLLVSKWNQIGMETRPLSASEKARAMRNSK